MAEVIAENTIRVLDHGFVRLDDAMASDLSVVNGARVSFARHKQELDESDEGLIRFLMRDRHGCYDDATDVLTDEGWKPWPTVRGDERFASRSVSGALEYQPALRLVRKEFKGHMIGFGGMSLDLLVTPDHRVLTSTMTTPETRRGPNFRLVPARTVLWRPHRHVATADWDAPVFETFELDGREPDACALLRLVGFFIGAGHLGSSNYLAFQLRQPRELAFLRRVVQETGFRLQEWRGDKYGLPVGPEARRVFAECYDEGRQKLIPRRLLEFGPPLLAALYEGLIESDGSRFERPGRQDRETYSTTSRKLADAVQELALKLGRSATVRPHRVTPGDGQDGTEPRWRVEIYPSRNSRPALCRTKADADNEMGVERYDGLIHCVEVPNNTLYVRRNGYPVWCGNTPFEHNAFRFHVRAPLFVAREWFRHRVGSFNEFSMRYAKASDEFYVPAPEDVRSQVGKPGAYSFEPVEPELAATTREQLQAVYDAAYTAYNRLVERGVARELARLVMPMGAYTEFYWTVNARSLMNFVSLRAAETAQREIRRYAEACERFLAGQMPITHSAFVENGRVAP
jgi:thymidylate synthase (FAD)